MDVALRAKLREPGRARKVRREGGLPAVLYGPSGNFPIRLDAREFNRLLANGQVHGLLRVDLEGDGTNRRFSVMVKEMQWHPHRGELLHVDLMEVREDKPVRTVVPIVLRGEEEASKRGIVQHQLNELEIECLPRNIPTAIEGDITQLPVGEELRVRDLEIPEGVRIFEDPEQIVAVLLPPKELMPEEEAEAGGSAETGQAPAAGTGTGS